MIFDLNGYVSCVYTSLTVISFAVFAIISVLFTYFREFTRKGISAVEITKLIFCVVCFLCVIVPNYPTLANGGISFLQEKDNDTIVCTGKIESICESSKNIPTYKYNHEYGADIVINGETYFAATAEEFNVGDMVEIHYFENSKFILEIQKIESE